MLQNFADLDTSLSARLDSFNAAEGSPVIFRVLGRTLEGDGAIIFLQPVSKATGEPYPGVVDWAVALRENGTWTITLPGDASYSAAYQRLPTAVLVDADSSPYTIHADPALAGDLSGYDLPFADGAWATVTRSYGDHGVGRIDFDLSGRDVTAANDGVIVYADDSHHASTYASGAWWYWNTVIIRHGEHEYSLYGHLEHDSIPQAITDACAETCAVPIKAGEVIAREGSTGYSSNPHLHVEFGQGFAVAAYPDSADQDRDGDRTEPIYAGYVYAEQNVGLSGYDADEVGTWRYGGLQQAAHGDPPPADVNLLVNGDFSGGTTGWTPSGQLNWSVQDGMLRFLRLRTSDPPDWAAFYQDVGYGIRAHTPFEATMQLGNTSGIAKTVTVSIFNRSGRQYGSFECAFSIPPNTQLSLYTLRGVAVNSWASARFEVSVNPADGSPAALIDDIALYYRPVALDNQCTIPAF